MRFPETIKRELNSCWGRMGWGLCGALTSQTSEKETVPLWRELQGCSVHLCPVVVLTCCEVASLPFIYPLPPLTNPSFVIPLSNPNLKKKLVDSPNWTLGQSFPWSVVGSLSGVSSTCCSSHTTLLQLHPQGQHPS